MKKAEETRAKAIKAGDANVKQKKQKLHAYIVIGDPNIGKSSTVRHLMGLTKGCPFFTKQGKMRKTIPQKWIRLVNGNHILVGMQGYCSLQELKNPVSAAFFVRFIQQLSPAVPNIILTLQLNPKGKQSAQSYVQYFQNFWNVTTVVLDSNIANVQNNSWARVFYGTNCRTIYSTRRGNPVYPTNLVAADVRTHFGWV
ncbi:hypothetical protein [Fibrobacter sp.]|uniref:hypothetical protein n=1 Tax=Fibrobacter sp. TaxID=35828 RepID=UPI0025BE6C21|nr:hypothetical protein [Fibrobacter sp.]MBR4008979.1 hypothetical protein [Fibrobacter sp.]